MDKQSKYIITVVMTLLFIIVMTIMMYDSLGEFEGMLHQDKMNVSLLCSFTMSILVILVLKWKLKKYLNKDYKTS